jgi:hypothetical protein
MVVSSMIASCRMLPRPILIVLFAPWCHLPKIFLLYTIASDDDDATVTPACPLPRLVYPLSPFGVLWIGTTARMLAYTG